MKQQLSKLVDLSIIVPVYNESAGLPIFHTSLKSVLEKTDWKFEIIYVDDGSLDDSVHILKKLSHTDDTVRPLFLSKNFGKEQATTAGIHNARGTAAMILDADGQHPVELIPEFVRKWQNGCQVVVGVRTSNKREGFVKRYGSHIFYRLLSILGVRGVVKGSTDFRLIDRQVIDSFKGLKEHNRVTRALIDWLGYDREYIEFEANAREHGEASYSFKKLTQLALNGFVSLSFAPLYMSGYLGLLITFVAFISSVFAVTEKYILNDPLRLNLTGTAILGIMVLFLVGILLICQGILAIYIARIYIEVQDRPLYIIKEG